MKKINKINLKENKKLGFKIFNIIVIFSIIIFMLFSLYNKKLKRLIKEESKITLETASAENISNLQSIIEEKQKMLKYLSQTITNNNNFDIEYNIEKLKLYAEFNNFYDMGVIDKSGICYTTLDEKFDLKQYDYFKNSINGNGAVYKSYINSKGEGINIFTEPVYLNGEVELILIATYKSNDFSNLINISIFNGNGKSIVWDSNGNSVTDPSKNKDSIEYNETNDEKDSIYNVIYHNIKNNKENFIEFDYLGKEYLAYYETIDINDWYLISYVPKNYIYRNLYKINIMTFISSIVIYLVIILLLAIIFKSYIRYQKNIASIVLFDDLTGERNFEYLKFKFNNMTDKDKYGKALIVMNINKFKIINIMYGSKVGDDLLKYISKVFTEVLPDEKLFKGNGDLFIFITNSNSHEEIREKIGKFEKRIREGFEKKEIVPITFSFGVCSFDKFEDLHSIYNNALISTNEIKGKVKDNIKFFTEESKNKIIENREIEAGFIEAKRNNEFEVWYQPKYNMKTNEIYGAEALVRWKKSDGTLISPASFIPVLENSGQIVQLDEVIIEKVFKDIREMKELGIKINPISINLSRVNIYNLEIVDKIKSLAKEYKIDSSDISFEITESALIENNKSINKLIRKLHKLGFGVDMDDYGVGTSTLNSLFASDFDTLKLDKSFIDYIGNEKMDTIIKSTIRMANELNMKIIAEGVETKEQVDFLINNNCNIAQGYYFSKPLNRSEYFKLYEDKFM